jgi:hypothetical protein
MSPSIPNPKDIFAVMTRPALLATISYAILGFVLLFPMGMTMRDPETGAPISSVSFGQRFMMVLVMLIPIALSVYSINCMVVGRCVVWSWVNAIGVALWVLSFLILSMMTKEVIGEAVATKSVTTPKN